MNVRERNHDARAETHLRALQQGAAARLTGSAYLQAAAGYLETDERENVEFYRGFGFVVQREEEVIGTPVWYMWRARHA